MSDQQPQQSPQSSGAGRSYGPVAAAYDRGRPAYPREAAAWLVGEQPVTVLELGAGTGKLTKALVGLGHDVHATDPDPAMLAVLAGALPDVRVSEAAAEEIPVPDRSVDVVVCAQAFHWFDHERALPEIARALKPGGRLALVWNSPDLRIPWVRKLARVIGEQDQRDDLAEPVVASPLFGFVDEQAFKHWQQVDRESILDLALSRSNVVTLDDEAREEKLAEVLALYDDYGRGMDGMQLPYATRCYRATVVEDVPRPRRTAAEPAGSEPGGEGTRGRDAAEDDQTPMEITSDGTDTDMLLIDFR